MYVPDCGVDRPALLAMGRKRRSSSESVSVKVRRSSVLLQDAHPRAGCDAVERRPELLRIHEVALVGFVDCRLELTSLEARGDVYKGADRGGDRDPVPATHVPGSKRGAAVGNDSGSADEGRYGDLDRIARDRADLQ
jgi:hypothetical protein